MFEYGNRVVINLPKKGDGITEGMRAYQGKEATVERTIFFSGSHAHELYGVMSEKGKHYTFEEKWLEPAKEGASDETDGKDSEVHR